MPFRTPPQLGGQDAQSRMIGLLSDARRRSSMPLLATLLGMALLCYGYAFWARSGIQSSAEPLVMRTVSQPLVRQPVLPVRLTTPQHDGALIVDRPPGWRTVLDVGRARTGSATVPISRMPRRLLAANDAPLPAAALGVAPRPADGAVPVGHDARSIARRAVVADLQRRLTLVAAGLRMPRTGVVVVPANRPAALSTAPRAAAATPLSVPTHSMSIWLTGYDLTGTTATGAQAGPGICAVDPAFIPLGTRITINGVGSCLAADTGPEVLGAHIDLWVPDAATAYSLTGWHTASW